MFLKNLEKLIVEVIGSAYLIDRYTEMVQQNQLFSFQSFFSLLKYHCQSKYFSSRSFFIWKTLR